MPSKIEGDIHINGNLSSKTLSIPNSTVTNNAITASAGISATKLQHQHRASYSQESATTTVNETKVVHVVYGATGSIIDFKAATIVPCLSGAVIDVDLFVNGSTVLSAEINLSDADSAYEVLAGTITSASLVAGDVVEIDIAITTGGGTMAKGVFASLTIHEDAI